MNFEAQATVTGCKHATASGLPCLLHSCQIAQLTSNKLPEGASWNLISPRVAPAWSPWQCPAKPCCTYAWFGCKAAPSASMRRAAEGLTPRPGSHSTDQTQCPARRAQLSAVLQGRQPAALATVRTHHKGHVGAVGVYRQEILHQAQLQARQRTAALLWRPQLRHRWRRQSCNAVEQPCQVPA